jgi:hypothetical protein
MTDNWIPVPDSPYFLHVEPMQVVVAERRKAKKSGKCPSGWKYYNQSYHPNIRFAIEELYDRRVRARGATAKTLEELVRIEKEAYDWIKHNWDRQLKEIASAA